MSATPGCDCPAGFIERDAFVVLMAVKDGNKVRMAFHNDDHARRVMARAKGILETL